MEEHVINKISPRVLVALSGGVDSSVSAALLRDEGYRTEGVFVVTWTAPWLPCTWREEHDDARRVAEQLGIPFHTLDLSDAYERAVVRYMVTEYTEGRTPNPDVMCNKEIKFGALFAWARDHGFDYLATGHYAQCTRDSDTGLYRLHAGLDRNKDQSYFLWTLTQEHLAHVLFPVGNLEKRDVRALARHYNLATADKKDSQGICFVGHVDLKEFLSRYVTTTPGNVLSPRGDVLGTHDGALFYTLGQRHGFSVRARSPHDTPLYVTEKDITRNTITVAPQTHPLPPGRQDIQLRDTHWVAPDRPVSGTAYLARLRYRQKLFPVTYEETHDCSSTVAPMERQRYVSPGQSMVLYDGNECLGGGIIVS